MIEKQKNINRSEQGTALIVVLGLIALVSVLTVSIVAFSQISDKISKVTCDRSKADYWAESAVARTIWLLRNDIAAHPTRSLGKEEEDEETERFFADGSSHKMDNYEEGEVESIIYDAVSGIDISGSKPALHLKRPQSYFEDDEKAFEHYNFFLNSLRDYVDTNDFTHQNGGFEREEYEAEGMAPLPRNYAMQFREEILWVPGFSDFFSCDKYGTIPAIRIIAPKGLKQLRGKNNFFSADVSQMQSITKLDEAQIAQVIDARNAWNNDKTPLSDSLDVGILSKLKRHYSFKESGYYTIVVNASPGEGFAGVRLSCTIQIGRKISSSSELRYYEWRFLR